MLLCYVMLCYVMLCYVMLCYVMLCYAMLCYAMLCYAMLCYGMLTLLPLLQLTIKEGVGKSSLISTFVSRHFSEVVSGIMTPVRLPPSEPNDVAITTILDSQQGDKALLLQSKSDSSFASLLQRTEQQQQQQQPAQNKTVDSIILVYDLDRVETFYRLENHWLPLIERFYGGEVSIPVVCFDNTE
jgi:hypothetical protein